MRPPFFDMGKGMLAWGIPLLTFDFYCANPMILSSGSM